LEVEYGWGGSSEHKLLEPIFADLEPDARAYFTEELEGGVSAYYFDGYGATVERSSVAEIDEGLVCDLLASLTTRQPTARWRDRRSAGPTRAPRMPRLQSVRANEAGRYDTTFLALASHVRSQS
jgi:hypothetical protein